MFVLLIPWDGLLDGFGFVGESYILLGKLRFLDLNGNGKGLKGKKARKTKTNTCERERVSWIGFEFWLGYKRQVFI